MTLNKLRISRCILSAVLAAFAGLLLPVFKSQATEDQAVGRIKALSQVAVSRAAALHQRISDPNIQRRFSDYLRKDGPRRQGEVEFIHSIKLMGNRGWAIDWNGALHTSRDGGVNWSETLLPLGREHKNFLQDTDRFAQNPFPCRSLDFVDSKFGVATCGSKVLATRDGGRTWKTIRQFAKLDEHVVASCASTNCWVGGNIKGVQLWRRDTGKWTEQQLPQQDAPLQCLLFLSPDVGKAITSLGKVYETKDGGATWLSISERNSREPNGCFFISENVGWIVGGLGSVSKTTDGGRTWADKITVDAFEGVPMDQANLQAVRFADANFGWADGWQGVVLATTDGGENWTRQQLWEMGPRWEPGQYWLSLYSLYVRDRNTAWIAGNSGNIFATIDGGRMWVPLHGPAFEFLQAIPAILDGTSQN